MLFLEIKIFKKLSGNFRALSTSKINLALNDVLTLIQTGEVKDSQLK